MDIPVLASIPGRARGYAYGSGTHFGYGYGYGSGTLNSRLPILYVHVGIVSFIKRNEIHVRCSI